MGNIGDTAPIASMISGTSVMISGGNFNMISAPSNSQRGA